MKCVCIILRSVLSRHAFVSFADDASASTAVKQGATFKNTQLKVAFQTKRPEPQKRSMNDDDNAGPKSKKLKNDAPAAKGSAATNGVSPKGKKPIDSDDDDEDDDDDDESVSESCFCRNRRVICSIM